MGWNTEKIRGFWTAEEVPRWIGLSLVGVLLLGMTGVSYRSAISVRESYLRSTRDAGVRSVEVLAWMLARDGVDDARRLPTTLRTFALHNGWDQLRVYDRSGRVLASIDASEVGHDLREEPGIFPAPTAPRIVDLPPSRSGDDRWSVSAPITLTPPAMGGAADANRFVQCVMMSTHDVGMSDLRTSVAAVMLLAVGTFLVVYRLMRKHFRCMSRISENLLYRGDQLEQDLSALRLADSEGALAGQWNRLIDLVDDLSTSARRATASVELKEVLEKSRGGALADVLNAVPDGLLHVTDRDECAYANAMATRLMGMSTDDGNTSDRKSLGSMDVGPTGKLVVEHIMGALDAEGSFQTRTAIIEADEGASSFRVRVLPINTSKRRGECVVTITDVSQQMRSDRAAEDFVAQVTHELRTPLTNIRAYAETLSSGVFDDPKVITDCYNVITKETRRLSRLIEDILSVSQLEAGSLQLRMDDVDLKTLVADAVRDLRGLADEKHIDMQVSLPSKLPPIRGDRDKLTVVLNNLLGNALKYTPSGGLVQIGCQANDERVLVTVKDDGIGIEPADQDRIFEKFQRGSSPDVDDITGTGIGLTTARDIVRKHGGDIEVMSALGEGATFVVRLPLQESRAKYHALTA